MAKQVGPHFFIGTIGDLVFYKMNEEYYVRKKSSYNKKKMQKAGAYPLMHLKQSEFGQASKLASQVRRQLPLVKRREVTIGSLTREARKLLREGRPHEEIKAILLQKVLPAAPVAKQPEQNPKSQKPAAKPPAPSQAKTPKPAKHSNWQINDKGELYKQPKKAPKVNLKDDNANSIAPPQYGWPYSFNASLLHSRQWLN